MKKGFFALLLILLAAILLAGGGAAYFLQISSALDKEDSEGVLVKIEEGMSAKSIARLLKDKALIRNENAFYITARYPKLLKLSYIVQRKPLHFTDIHLKHGIYRIKKSMDIGEVLELLSSDKTESIRVTIAEGLTIKKTALLLEKSGVCSAKEFVKVCYDENAAKKYSLYGRTLEGYLFPDTYYFEIGISAVDAAEIMVNNFKKHAEKVFDKEISIEELYKTLILASIVEREYRVESEAPLIAGVFLNRIKDGVGLYSCATIEYIITEIEGKEHPKIIKYSDLENDSPYNTYKWASLPPTPISNPGMIALLAAIHPKETDYYYFRLSDADEGRHVFSKTLTGHLHEGVVFKTKEER